MVAPGAVVALLDAEAPSRGPQHEGCSPAPTPGGTLPATASDCEKMRQVLAELVRISLNDHPLGEQLQEILDLIVSVPWLTVQSKGAIFLVEEEPEVLVMKAHKNLSPPLLTSCARVPFGHCLCGRAASAARVEFANCVDHRHDIRFEGMAAHGHYIVPVILRGSVKGVLNLYVAEGHVRNPQQEEFLRAVSDLLSGILGLRITQDRLSDALDRLRKTLGTTIQAMGTALETRDPYTAGHQRRVSDLARAIATELKLSPDQVEAVRSAGTIHDIGKIAVPAEILSKPGRLTDTEMELVKVHPKVGYDILKNIDFPWPLAQFVLQHHERMNGSGYPAGLQGKDIFLEARILGIADVVEAMANHRPYQASLGVHKALEEIATHKEVLYDAAAADACLNLFAERKFRFSP